MDALGENSPDRDFSAVVVVRHPAGNCAQE
jgi:hypothetical protein